MRCLKSVFICFSLSGCAFAGSVQRIGVDYNDAVAGMANELTLLNVLRAREDLPLHYTAVSRLSGSLTVKAGANINGGLRADGTTTTNQTATNVSATPSTVTTAISQIAEGVDVFTPAVSGEVSTGPTFDIAILDTQKFYNGILGAIPFSTVENYISQGYSDQLLMRLLVERIDFRQVEGPSKGQLLFSWENMPTGIVAQEFADNVACYTLGGRAKKPIDLAPASRLRRTDMASAVGITVQELALLDGKLLELSGPLGVSSTDDGKIMIRRPASDKRVADLTLKAECQGTGGGRPKPKGPPAEAIYLGNFTALVLSDDQKSDREIKVEPTITFRSTESVIRFVGRYIRVPNEAPLLDNLPIFSVVNGRPSGAVVSTEVLGKRYSVANDENRRRNMLVIALIQQLLNLHKESTDRPLTVPVQVIGGS